ncbi:MAG: hypothetical protein Q7U91_13120 [Sideroxyarcus sp.]|nr:hypothetical protein [Sideroxyarcus sp.]
MPTTENKLLRENIRRTLALRAGVDPDSNAFAEATLGVWHEVEVRLTPVLGAGGIDALFRRSLHITGATYSWLALTTDDENSAVLRADLKARLAGHETAVACEAGYTLLVTFSGLLATLIGNSLTERLLNPVWVAPLTLSEEEKSP